MFHFEPIIRMIGFYLNGFSAFVDVTFLIRATFLTVNRKGCTTIASKTIITIVHIIVITTTTSGEPQCSSHHSQQHQF